jgi:hypothetical protein
VDVDRIEEELAADSEKLEGLRAKVLRRGAPTAATRKKPPRKRG